MDNFVDERDYKLLDGDKYSFAILRMIVGRECQLLLTDHEKAILCKAVEVFPAWIWTPDDASPEEMERVWSLAAENGLLRTGTTNISKNFDAATQTGPAMDQIQYARMGEREPESYYLCFDAQSPHLSALPDAVDNAAWEVALNLLKLDP